MEQIGTDFAKDLIEATREVEGAIKDSTNPFFNSQYADLGSVIAATKPHLLAHNIAILQRCAPGSGACVETILVHSSGEMLSLGAVSVPYSDQKNPAQAYGAALTYGRRYSLAAALSVPQLDDDANSAAQPVVTHSKQVPTEDDVPPFDTSGLAFKYNIPYKDSQARELAKSEKCRFNGTDKLWYSKHEIPGLDSFKVS
jgi:hypothetical protein